MIIREFVGTTAEPVGDAEQLKQQENFTVLTPELPYSNGCNGNLDNCDKNSLGSWKDCAELNDTTDTNSLGSWKDEADVEEPFDEAFAPRNKSDSYVGGEDRSLDSWKDCADLNDTADTNSLGSWEDGANRQEPFDEALARRNKSDSYVGGDDHSSRPVKEASRSKTFSSSRPAASPSMKMSWADMDQEDDLDAEEISQSSSQLSNWNGVKKEETSIQETKPIMDLSREHREHIRFCNVKRKKDFICLERVNGKIVNALDGLELHTGVFSTAEQNRIVKFVEKLEEMGKCGQLKERTYTAPKKWMKGKGRVTIQFGCCYNYATDRKGNPPGIVKSETVDPLPDLLKNMIRRLVKWHVLPPDCVPDSCIVNIYEEGDCIPPHIDSHDFVRPFCTVSFLSECNILFGSNLKTVGPGEFAGAFAIPLPMGSVLVLNGNGADVAKHCVLAVPTKRISITFRRMDKSRRPIGYVPEEDLLDLRPLSYEADRYHKSRSSEPWHSTRKQLGRREENKETVKISLERNRMPWYMDRNRQGPVDR
ncbi:RNA demethylase ALKBH9B-like [Lycium ferocissimum]|uniref:RNA demethylase ALKBH9B-like n=1 Tax=Lycium ferocissimum TaxID=112874 RepID=UPI0028162CE8|nr:RNA demethylase ALKBH9B-like [Lycium ferocissimum]